MKRYTTAQAISVLSKPGREGWYAVAKDYARFLQERITYGSERYQFECRGLGRDWEMRAFVNKRNDWRIIKPKREKMRRIGTTAAPFHLSKTIHLLESSDHEYEIFARRVGK